MKIAVIGGNRFTGKNLVEKLIDNKYKVTLLNRSATGHEKANIFKFDRDTDKIDFKKFDCIVDMCLYTMKQFKLIKKTIPKNTKYIFISSGAVEYEDVFGEYAKQKKLIEIALSKTKFDYTIIRPSYIDGVGSHLKRIEYFINSIKNNTEIRIEGESGNYPVNIVWVGDVVRTIKKIIETDSKITKKKIYNVCANESVTLDEVIEQIKSKLKIDTHKMINTLGSPFNKSEFEMDNSLTKKELKIKFNPVSYIIDILIKELDD